MRPTTLVLRGLTATTMGRKAMRYSLASVVNVIVAETTLAVAFGIFHWSARVSNVVAAGVATVPSYWLARRWVWGRSGRSHLLKEVLPFWVLAFVGLGISTLVAGLAEARAQEATSSRFHQTLIVMGSVFVAFGGFWVLKFVIFNNIVFADRSPAIDDRPPATPATDKDRLAVRGGERGPGR